MKKVSAKRRQQLVALCVGASTVEQETDLREPQLLGIAVGAVGNLSCIGIDARAELSKIVQR